MKILFSTKVKLRKREEVLLEKEQEWKFYD